MPEYVVGREERVRTRLFEPRSYSRGLISCTSVSSVILYMNSLGLPSSMSLRSARLYGVACHGPIACPSVGFQSATGAAVGASYVITSSRAKRRGPAAARNRERRSHLSRF